MPELFIHKPTLTFDRAKRAGIEVDENPDMWSRQVLSELYRQVPSVAEYTPTVMFMKTDEEQGYALGAVIISNSTDSALAATRMTRGAPKALVPVVIKNHTLAPLDILMTSRGHMMPLNEGRLREALFRPQTFEMVTEEYGDTSLWNMFYPPGRSDNTFGAGMSGSADGGAVSMIQGPGMKMSSARFELLQDVVGPSLLGPDLDLLIGKLDADETLRKVAFSSDTMLGALAALQKFEGSAVRDTAGMLKAAASSAGADVVQVGYDEARREYWVKSASRSAFYHAEPEFMDRKEFLKFAGDEVTRSVDTSGTVTIAASTAVDEKVDPSSSKWKLITEPGIYKVRTIAGKELTGWVLPSLLDTDGTRVPMMVFTNGAAATIQDEIVGARVATGVDLPSGPAKGTGLFYVAGQGGIEATVPLNIVGSEAGMDGGDSYIVRTLGGEESRVRLVPGMLTMRALGEEIMLPSTAKFLPLDQETMVTLVSTVGVLSKTASSVLERSLVIIGDGERTYQIDCTNLPKLASMFPRRLSHDNAMLMLCAAGLDADAASRKLASADQRLTKVAGLNDVLRAHDRLEASRQKAAASSAAIRALRQDLVKEATVLPDVMTVDSVLSLGFINSENVRMFISRLPYLEKALSMICELTLTGRLGMNEIPEAAAARAARGLDDVIQGLRALSMRNLDTLDERA